MSTHFKTVIAVVGVLLGVVVGELFSYASEVAVFALILGVMQGGLYVWERRSERQRKQTSDVVDVTRLFSLALVTSLFSIGVFFGIVRTQFVEEKNNIICPTSCTLEVRIISSPETQNEYQVFTVRKQESDKYDRDIRVRTSLYPKYQIGETLTLRGKVTEPKTILPHGDEKYFDYTSYLHVHNIGSEAFYPGIEVRDIVSHTLSDSLGRIKNDMVGRVDRYMNAPASSLASGMLFGNSSFSKEMIELFRVAGLSHIIVLSGFNIAIIISFTLLLTSFLPFSVRLVVAVGSVLVFVVMVGAEASVIRATLMAFIALFALSLGREYEAKQALILSLLGIVLYDPYSLLHNVSLHLSFIATTGIVYMNDGISIFIGRYIAKKIIQEVVATTLSAYILTLPYVMYTFGTVSLYAIIANLLVLTFVPFGMLTTSIVVVSSYLSGGLAMLVGFLATFIMDYIIMCAKFVSLLPYASMSIRLPLWVMFALYCMMSIFFIFMTRKKNNETLRTENGIIISDVIRY